MQTPKLIVVLTSCICYNSFVASLELQQSLLICTNPFTISEADPTRDWINCGTSESRLEEAIVKNLTVIAYGGVIVKVSGPDPLDKMGYVVGLCFRPVTNGKYTFYPGYWYHPKYWEEFQQVFNSGQRVFSPRMEWSRTRPMHEDWKEITKQANRSAEDLLVT